MVGLEIKLRVSYISTLCSSEHIALSLFITNVIHTPCNFLPISRPIKQFYIIRVIAYIYSMSAVYCNMWASILATGVFARIR